MIRIGVLMVLLILMGCEQSTSPTVSGSGNPPRTNPGDAARYAGLIQRIADQENVDPNLIEAVIRQESNFNPNALSSAGAAGLMQLMPATARDYGLEPSERYNPVKNIQAGTRHLKMLLKLFHGDVRLALAAYNAGQGTVIRYGYTVPPFQETQTYVKRVTGFYRSYQTRTRIARYQTRHQYPAQAMSVAKPPRETINDGS